MRKYVKKPIVVEAVQWDGTVEGATQIINWMLENDGTARYHDGNSNVSDFIAIDTLEGVMRVYKDAWVIKGIKDEFYSCKNVIFEETYVEA